MPDPQPVVVQNEEPLPVVVHDPVDTKAQSTEKTRAAIVKSDEESRVARSEAEERTARSAAADEEAIRVSHGQRRVNLIWELTQSVTALTIVLTTSIGIFIGRVVNGNGIPFPAEWWTIVGLVIGFYFGRTNHTRVGGVGRSDPPER